MARVHFWTLRRLKSLSVWDPDLEPGRFIDAYGHGFLELFVRLSRRGHPVAIGPAPAPDAKVLVVSFTEISAWRPWLRGWTTLRLAAASRGRAVVSIRADVPLSIRPPRFVRTEVVASRTALSEPSTQRWLPLLPQRGLVPRRRDRRGIVRRAAIMTKAPNVPAFLRDASFQRDVAQLGVELAIVTTAKGPAAWHNFQEVDVAICARKPEPGAGRRAADLRKPATKLLNAWQAGAIPIVAPEPAYLELVRPEVDALVAESPDQFVACLRRLREDPALVARLEAGGQERAVEFSPERIAAAWEDLLRSELPPAQSIDALRWALGVIVTSPVRLVARGLELAGRVQASAQHRLRTRR